MSRMRVFISWSGEASYLVARSLKEWLPDVIKAVDVFLSSEDIDKGTQWFRELGGELDKSEFGILCLTRDNLSKPWILYEAGAIAKRFDEGRIVPLLIGLEVADLEDPLRQFNPASLKREEMAKVVLAINRRLGSEALSEKKLKSAFDASWPRLVPHLRAATNAASAPARFDYDVFLSAPMAAFSDDGQYRAARAEIAKVFTALTIGCGYRVYWAAEKIESIADFDSLDVSVMADLKAIDASRSFMLIYPEKLVTSALFEAGYALARGRPASYFVRQRDDLPFLMRELAGSVPTVKIHTAADWKDFDALAKKVVRHKVAWFPK